MFLEGKGKGVWIRDSFFVQGVVRVAGGVLLIPFLGSFGAAWAVVISRLVHLLRYRSLMRRFEREGGSSSVS